MVIGIPALRIRGLYLAVVTLAFALAVSSYVLELELHPLAAARHRSTRSPLFGRIQVNTETRFYYLCLACLVLVVAAARGIRRSRTGRVLIGVRENPRAAQAFGVNATSDQAHGLRAIGLHRRVRGRAIRAPPSSARQSPLTRSRTVAKRSSWS